MRSRKHREIMGATDPKKAAPGTIRADLAHEHRAERGARLGLRPRPRRSEIAYFFSTTELHSARLSAAREPHRHDVTGTQAALNLLGLPRAALEAFVAELGSKPFRARQLMNWIYKRGEGSIAQHDRPGEGFPRAARASRRNPHAARS